MKLSVKGLALAAGLGWAGLILAVGLTNLGWPGYGVAFLDIPRSLYPGYAALSGFAAVLVGAVYGFCDGAICGAIFAWLYNMLSGQKKPVTNA